MTLPRRSVCLTVLCLAVCGSVRARELIQNGGFDYGDTGWRVEAGLDDAVRFGDYDYFRPPLVLRIEHGKRAASSSVSQTVTTLRAKTVYTLSCWLKTGVITAQPDAGARVVVRAGDSGPVLAVSEVFRRELPWRDVHLVFSTGPYRSVSVCLELVNARGTVRFDELEFRTGVHDRKSGDIAPDPTLQNVALGKPYSWSRKPSYPLCTDEGDTTDLTDGLRTAGHFWVQKSTVGWQHPRGVVSLTIDLGEVEPIMGAAFSTAGGSAGVSFPNSIAVLVSENGKEFHLAGDLARDCEGRLPPGYMQYATHTYRSRELRTKGRYVQFSVVASGTYLFCDEIEVYRGDSSLLAAAYRGEPVGAAEIVDRARLTAVGVQRRIRMDAEHVIDALQNAPLSAAGKADGLAELSAVLSALAQPDSEPVPDEFLAVLPLNSLHRRVFSVHGQVLASAGTPPLAVWHTEPYQLLSPFEAPAGQLSSLRVALMQNERRAEVVNLTNATAEPAEASLQIEGLPGGPNPGYIEVCRVECVDTRKARAVASALVQLAARDGVYRVRVPAGMTRQVWLSVKPDEGVTAGTHAGRVVITSRDLSHTVGFEIEVAPIRFPERTDLRLGLWDYVSGNGYQITDENKAEAIAVARRGHVNVVWAHPSTIPRPEPALFSAAGDLVGQLDYTKWDAFVKLWPDAAVYMVFGSYRATSGFAGKRQGSPEFERALAQWAADWARHNRDLGLRPRQAGVLFIDEPQTAEHFKACARFAKGVKAGTDEILIFNDPHIRCAGTPEGRDMMAVTDALCPNLPQYLGQGDAVRAPYHGVPALGKELWFYSCSGPTRTFDPSYYRLHPWHCLVAGATGSGFWAYGDAGKGDNWNEYWAVGGHSYTPVYIGPDSVTTSKHWEATAEGVQDYQYFVMLRARITGLEKLGVASPELVEAKRLAATLPSEVVEHVLARYGTWYVSSWRNHSHYAEVARLKVLAALVSLAEK